MPTGMLLLLITAALIYFGAAQRVLDRMRLTDSQALLFIGLMIGGSFIDIPLYQGTVEISVNVGGALVPLALCIYLLLRTDTARERVRGIVAALVTAGIVFAVSQLTEFGPTDRALIDPMWLFSIVAGVVGYLAGRSRRSAFIAGTLGIILTDVIHTVRALATGIPTTAALGGAGIFDTVVIAGIIAVLLAELVGETRERIQGGPGEHEGQTVLHNEEFLQMETQQNQNDGEGKEGHD
ncbi:MAG TPA: DUF1614 domain-containing protein [Firmicutes bacterium]|jgi:uncharacterized membrane protein|nr:DUF1614 domain-containing protein [Bacillota bacterium]